MILEVAEIRIGAGNGADFEAAVGRGLDAVLRHSPGFVSARLQRGVESPERYLLLIEWETLEAHTVGFRQSERFAHWRAIVGSYFAEPPRVEHFAQAAARAA